MSVTKGFLIGVALGLIILHAAFGLSSCQRRVGATTVRPFDVYQYNDVCVFISTNEKEMRILPRSIVGGDCLP